MPTFYGFRLIPFVELSVAKLIINLFFRKLFSVFLLNVDKNVSYVIKNDVRDNKFIEHCLRFLSKMRYKFPARHLSVSSR